MNYQNQFQWGMGQDDNLLAVGQCIYSHGIDTTRVPSEIRLMAGIEDFASVTETQPITSIFSPVAGTVWFGTSDGKIKDTWGGTIADTWAWIPIIDACLFLGNFYVFTRAIVYKYTYTAWVLSSKTTFVAAWSTSRYYRHPVIFHGWEMYFPQTETKTNNIGYTDSTGVLQTLFSTDFSQDVRALTIQGSTLRIYTENVLSIMDIGSKTITYSQLLPFVVNGAKSDGKVDYVTTDSDEMYVLSGLEWRKLAEFQQSDLTDQVTGLTGSKFTFKTSKEATALATGNSRVFTLDRLEAKYLIYGKKMEWLPNAFCYWPIYTALDAIDPINYELITTFHAVFQQDDITYVSYLSGGEYRIWRVNSNDPLATANEWIYVMKANDFGDYSMLKAIDEIRVGKSGTGGTLWASIDGWAFEQIDDLDQTELYNKTMDFKRDFHELALMVKTTGCIVRNIDVRYTPRQI